MTIAEFSRRIELHFWDMAIPAISASPLLRRGIKVIYRINRKTAPLRWYIVGASIGIFGFFNGMLFYWFLAR
jgi:hypothetical protein